MKTEAEFWQQFRRQLLGLAALIERQYLVDDAPLRSEEPHTMSRRR